ncbi:MAG: type III secretion system export apparatus subunit SctR [Proteobacteria bacterium]|nr:type III secretion system export apparatus subunit SctR [Pseudomonadota bacterium]
MSAWPLAAAALAAPVASTARLESSADPLALILLLSALALLPFLLAVTTSFVKFSVVLAILRNALGTPQVPPTIVITSLALILTGYVMAPTAIEVYRAAEPAMVGSEGAPLLSDRSVRALLQGASAAREPLQRFLVRHAQAADRALFRDMARRLWPAPQRDAVTDRDLVVVVPAFVISQLAAAFKIGFLLFVPFLVIEMVVANVLLALGMHMLAPTTVSLPFKLLLFVLVDGWRLLVQGLVLSFG